MLKRERGYSTQLSLILIRLDSKQLPSHVHIGVFLFTLPLLFHKYADRQPIPCFPLLVI